MLNLKSQASGIDPNKSQCELKRGTAENTVPLLDIMKYVFKRINYLMVIVNDRLSRSLVSHLPFILAHITTLYLSPGVSLGVV